MVERFSRTLKSKMFCYFTFKRTRHYVGVLPWLVDSYNAMYRRLIGMPPNEVNTNNEGLVRSRLYPPSKKLCWCYGIGDRVRIVTMRHAVHNGLCAVVDARTVQALSYDRQHLSYDVCLEVRGEIIRTALFCVLCTEAVHSHKHT